MKEAPFVQTVSLLSSPISVSPLVSSSAFVSAKMGSIYSCFQWCWFSLKERFTLFCGHMNIATGDAHHSSCLFCHHNNFSVADGDKIQPSYCVEMQWAVYLKLVSGFNSLRQVSVYLLWKFPQCSLEPDLTQILGLIKISGSQNIQIQVNRPI